MPGHRINGQPALTIYSEREGYKDSPLAAKGRPYNDLFTSLFQGLGIPKNDFTQPGNSQGGFGDYRGAKEPNGQALAGDFSKRKLPMFNKG